MDRIAGLLNFCFVVLNLSINLFGYSITMWQLFIFGGLVYIVVWLFFGMMR